MPKKRDENTQSTIEKLTEENQELKESFARARADYINLENRVAQQNAQFAKITTATILGKFIAIVDNLERASAHINDEGLTMVLHQTHKMLEDEGVEEMSPKGESYDVSTMECLQLVDGEKDIVLEVVQKGYQLGDHLIRPAKVLVGNGTQPQKDVHKK